MYKDLGIPEVEYNKIFTKVGIKTIYRYLTDYGSGQISLCLYADIRGDFTKKLKYKTDLIAKAIYDTLPGKDKLQIHEYFEWLKKNP